MKDVFFLFQLSRLLVVKQLVPPLVLLRLKMRLKRVLIRKIPKPFEEGTNERTNERKKEGLDVLVHVNAKERKRKSEEHFSLPLSPYLEQTAQYHRPAPGMSSSSTTLLMVPTGPTCLCLSLPPTVTVTVLLLVLLLLLSLPLPSSSARSSRSCRIWSSPLTLNLARLALLNEDLRTPWPPPAAPFTIM